MSETSSGQEWDLEIKPKAGLFEVNLREVWRYRDLIMLFVQRDLVSAYKQTILGPLWFVLQPLFSTVIFTIVFARIANLSTNGVPPLLFYLSGMVCWNYFSSSLLKASYSLVSNSNIFGKVYFPRLAAPISGIISNLVTFGAQLSLFIVIYLYYAIAQPGLVAPTHALWVLPIILILLSGLSLGLGLIVASLTTRFRDLQFFLSFGLQLLMYATPVIYPLSSVPEKYRLLVQLNPVAPLIEWFRAGTLGAGLPDPAMLAYSAIFTLVSLFLGVVMFNQEERTFMDNV
jgi:lipopolysaccharide transport system permease protein